MLGRCKPHTHTKVLCPSDLLVDERPRITGCTTGMLPPLPCPVTGFLGVYSMCDVSWVASRVSACRVSPLFWSVRLQQLAAN